MLRRLLGGSFLGKSNGKFGFGATHRGNSLGVGAGGIGGFALFKRGSLGFMTGKNGFGLSGPKISGEGT